MPVENSFGFFLHLEHLNCVKPCNLNAKLNTASQNKQTKKVFGWCVKGRGVKKGLIVGIWYVVYVDTYFSNQNQSWCMSGGIGFGFFPLKQASLLI